MTKFGLGKGLAEIRTEMGEPVDLAVLSGAERVVVRQIPIAHIAPNPDQPRKTFTPAELSDLTASIRQQGVISPILIRQTAPNQYEIIAGERRWRAAAAAGLADIPAIVKNLDDNNAMEIALIENVQRENLNPVEEGAAYKNLMDKLNYTIADITRLIGKSESYIRNLMRLTALPESVLALVRAGELSASHARTIATAADPESLARQIIEQNLSVSDTEKLAATAARAKTARARKNSGTPNGDEVNKIAKKLSAVLRAPVKIKPRKHGAGDIIIRFSSMQELNEITDKLGK